MTHPIIRHCLKITPNDIEISGWEALNNEIASVTASNKDTLLALGIDLSWHNDYQAGAEPAIEVSLYSDEAFPFSRSTRDDIVDHIEQETYGPEWQGSFFELISPLNVVGLGELHRLIQDADEYKDPARPFGEYWRFLMFVAVAVKRLGKQQIQTSVPVIFATHDLGPCGSSVVWVAE